MSPNLFIFTAFRPFPYWQKWQECLSYHISLRSPLLPSQSPGPTTVAKYFRHTQTQKHLTTKRHDTDYR